MNSSFASYPVSLFSKLTTGFYQYGGIPFYILGNFGNISSLLIFSQKSWRKNVCVFYFLIGLLLDVIYINSSMLGYIFIYGFTIDLIKSSAFFCKIHRYLTFFPSVMSATILILASIDRLLITSQNVDTRLYSSKRLGYFSISIATIFWLLFFIHVLIKFDIQQMGPFVSICLFDTRDFYNIFLDYSMVTINVVSFLMMIILSALSFKNVHRIRSIPRRQRQTGRVMHKKDFQLLRCLFAKDIIYIICTVYISIYFLYKLDPKSRPQSNLEQEFDRFIFNLGCWILYVPSCVSFFIFITLSKAFRQSCQRLIWKMLGKDFNTSREEDPNDHGTKKDQNELVVVSTIIV